MVGMRRVWFGLILACLTPALFGIDAAAQQPNFLANDVVAQAQGLPDLPPQGAWGEIINVTSRWIVIQNHKGQQFPVSVDDIQEFLIRWPTSFNALTPESVIEAVGADAGSNIVQTDHVDVFEGTDRTLVAPTYNSLLPNNMVVTTLDPGFNRYMNAWDYAGQNMLYGWAYPVPVNTSGIPSRLHVVGPVINRQENQVRIGLPGNNAATVIPPPSGDITITQITRGNSTLAKKGDYAFMMPLQLTQQGLVLSQLVVFKQITLAQFAAQNR